MYDQIDNCYLDPKFSAADCCWEFNIIAVVVDEAFVVVVDVAVVVVVVSDVALVVVVVAVSHR